MIVKLVCGCVVAVSAGDRTAAIQRWKLQEIAADARSWAYLSWTSQVLTTVSASCQIYTCTSRFANWYSRNKKEQVVHQEWILIKQNCKEVLNNGTQRISCCRGTVRRHCCVTTLNYCQLLHSCTKQYIYKGLQQVNRSGSHQFIGESTIDKPY